MGWRKYLRLANQSWLANLSYRVDFFFWGAAEFLDTTIWLFIWLIVYKDRPAIGGYDLNDTVTYFILLSILSILTQTWINQHLGNLIYSGDLSNILLKPVKIFPSIILNHISESLFELIIRAFLYIIITVLFTTYLFVPHSIWSVIYALFAVVLGVIWRYEFALILGSIAFWTKRVHGISGFSNSISRALGGAYAPLEFLPLIVQQIAKLTPFPYERYFAITIYLEKITGADIAKGFLIQIFWTILCFFVLRVIWKKGLHHFESIGN